MIGCEHTLAQLLPVRAGQDQSKLRLTQQDGLDRCPSVKNDVGEHAQFLHRCQRQVLHLVDHQEAAPTLASLIANHMLEPAKQRRLFRTRRIPQSKIRHRQPQQIVA
jgi:hypothetical protein